MSGSFALCGGRVFDGVGFLEGQALVVSNGRIEAIVAQADLSPSIERRDVAGSLLVPGFIDLQVNGGGGVLLNNQPDLDGIRTICSAHAAYGTTALLPTVITDTAEIRARAVEAGIAAYSQKVPGYLGLHLEGPHLSVARKGTHDPSLIRPLEQPDLSFLVEHAGHFGEALITLAPESVSPGDVTALVEAGYVVSLGHTNAKARDILPYVSAGASMATHLFNAMSQMENREPGLVGVALASGRLSCGLIADGFHVDPMVMQVALAAKKGPARIFLVTDAMSTIGTDLQGFLLNGREVFRRGGRLTLADGTLAGADIDMLSCVRFVHEHLGLSLADALNMASLYPAEAIGCATKGTLAVGMDADLLVLQEDLTLRATFIGGRCAYGEDFAKGVAA
ncbi:N-acetylglucosamine-6-phosphate deacetylase [uncultured Agrobacterium sp.]|uniref:N-acetylglucosamine-6-phosphate deacetylase n=1 Tax=uncultured Agrobacterium sp. TaxID=157277 RepID=UPI0025F570AF|nr:N-acetylglucosamine-6-phosphate deacetylase [uncultured Agrobacterium sp.]